MKIKPIHELRVNTVFVDKGGLNIITGEIDDNGNVPIKIVGNITNDGIMLLPKGNSSETKYNGYAELALINNMWTYPVNVPEDFRTQKPPTGNQ